ncbi:MAG: hypothetical protein GWN31_00500 [Candidatus Thorarchaeota archaeon]|nr:hypothetical protein [Candidatus Thorarchaeota archaeon]NIW12423.1 hypothetical protein [Candidatus Thorarchaeota archaeon]NIW50647.1 hypothetical protein [Candidatus Korarchaeota archaeon]
MKEITVTSMISECQTKDGDNGGLMAVFHPGRKKKEGSVEEAVVKEK